MKKYALIAGFAAPIVVAVVVVACCAWLHDRKGTVTTGLVDQLRAVGIASPVEVRKSKFDTDDWKFKMWFRVPGDPRIADVFWCDDAYQFYVLDDHKHKVLSSAEFAEFIRSADADAGEAWQPARGRRTDIEPVKNDDGP